MANLIQNKYFKSKDIRVFPSSFRGAYKSGLSSIDPEISFDPEARLNTEANFILPKPALGKTSYILEYNTTKDKITFVLGGYYFELLEVSTYISELKDKYVGIKLRTVTLHDVTNLESQFQYDISRNTDILDSWHEASDLILDYKFDTTYCFTGLKVLSSGMSSEGSTASIKLFNADGTLNREDCLPEITHGSGIQTLRNGQELIAAGDYQTVFGTFNDNKADTLFEIGNGENSSSRRNAVEVKRNHTIINTPVTLCGTTAVIGDLAVTKKVTSTERTEESDLPETLTTKSYVDARISNIGSGTVSGGEGQYVSSITQSGAAVTPTLQSFEASISEETPTQTNAPTSKAVNDFVKSQIAKLDVSEIGGSKTYLQKISEADGKITAVPKSFSSSINATDDSTAPTVKAVYDYIETIRTGIENKVTSDINSTVNNLKIETQVGGDGSYLKTIDQTSGKITPVSEAFDTAVTANTKNAPTSAAVKTFTESTVNSKVASIWTESTVKASSTAATSSLKSIVLEAAYPVGSVYICYSENKLTSCPIATKLGGTWEVIDAGKFLVSASTSNGIYKYGSTGGSADAVAVKHAHSFSNDITTNETGAHSHTIKWFDTSAHDSRTDNTFRSADSGDGGGVSESKWPKIETTSNGAHKHTFKLSGNTAESGYDGANKNLPPYIAVYMWRRTK